MSKHITQEHIRKRIFGEYIYGIRWFGGIVKPMEIIVDDVIDGYFKYHEPDNTYIHIHWGKIKEFHILGMIEDREIKEDLKE